MYKAIKRFLDIIISILVLPIFCVLTVIIFFAIKIDDGGPIFYKSYRIGKNGKLFNMVKYRSMKINAPDIRTADGSTYNGEDDPRVTKVGKFLRETSIDEIPQILNVLVGDMSLIGPRPDPPDWIDRYPEDVRVFLSVRPGITGYSQAYFRNNADSELKMKNDVYYATHYSFILDVKIVFKTILTVLGHTGVYRESEEKR